MRVWFIVMSTQHQHFLPSGARPMPNARNLAGTLTDEAALPNH